MENQTKDSSQTSQLKPGLISGPLNILWIDAPTFTASKKGIVFRFYAEPPDLLTVCGWTNDDSNAFPDDPDIIFKMGQVSDIPFGNKTYLGNLVLGHLDRKKINTLIADGDFKYILFKPHDPNNPNYPSAPACHITYDIELTNDNPESTLTHLASTATKISLNPSPPRNA